MTQVPTNNLLSRLLNQSEADPASAWAEVAATRPQQTLEPEEVSGDQKLDDMLQRIRGRMLMQGSAVSQPVTAEFFPIEPKSLEEAGLTSSEVESLILKLLLSRGDAPGRQISDHVKLPFGIIDQLLRQLKQEQVLVFKGSAVAGDYIYTLTDMGRERARRLSETCTYFGAAPVSFAHYVASVKAQSIADQHPTEEDLRRAFADLSIGPEMLRRLGPAVNSGRGLFLYGAAGNGKTSIAERVTKAFGEFIWIPRCVGVDGEIIRLFDPSNHEHVPLDESTGLVDKNHVDKRWIRIRRPTIVVGGELTMDNLEVTINTATGINESPMQMKSNCGTLVIDDFGRQKMSTDQLLNRWIVPLEKRYDFLNLPSGKKIQVPFDQLIIFSTNLQPRDLCDEAFLRRIPYKIEVIDPSEQQFRDLLKVMAEKLQVAFRAEVADYLVQQHYRAVNRPFRCCQPRDLMLQIKNFSLYLGKPAEMTPETVDMAVENYFAVM